MHVREIKARYVRMKNAVVTVEKYTDGSLALMGADFDEDGMPNVETFSVNLAPAYGLIPPDGHVYIPDYSESEGLADELVRVGVVELVETVTFGPFNTKASLVKLNPELLEGSAS